MRVGFVVETISSLKVLGPLLSGAPQQTIQPIVFVSHWRNRVKPYDAITTNQLTNTFSEVVPQDIHVYRSGGLARTVRQAGVGHVCLLNPYRNCVLDVPAMATGGVAVFGLDYFVNSIYVAAAQDDPNIIQRSLAALAGRIVASDFWRDLEFAVQPAHKKFGRWFNALGSPLIDVFADLDRDRARQALNLPAGKPIVTVFTPNIRDHQAYFFYGLDTKYKLSNWAYALRKFCDERGYLLVVKSRAKQWDAQPFLRVADHYIQDLPNQIHPSTSALLMGVSSLAVHFGSMMVLEAAGAGVPAIALALQAVDKLHGYMRPGPRQIVADQVLSAKPDSLFNFRQVSQSLPLSLSTSRFATLADAMINSLSDDSGDYNAFNQTYSGKSSGQLATERILQHIQNYRSADIGQPTAQLAAAEKIRSS